jgi:class 3 adenylate cyclase
MFTDLVGSTALSTKLDPEDMRSVIGAYHKCVAETVARFDVLLPNAWEMGAHLFRLPAGVSLRQQWFMCSCSMTFGSTSVV